MKRGVLYLLGIVCLLAIALGACSDETGSNLKITMTVMHGVNGELRNYVAYGHVMDGTTKLGDAEVRVGDTLIPYDAAPAKQYYYGVLDAAAFSPGEAVTVTVKYAGKTCIGSIMMPGGFVTNTKYDDDGYIIGWTYEGNHDWLTTKLESDPGNPTYDTFLGIGTAAAIDIDSPHTVPNAALPANQDCILFVCIESRESGVFSGADPSSSLACVDSLTLKLHRGVPVME